MSKYISSIVAAIMLLMSTASIGQPLHGDWTGSRISFNGSEIRITGSLAADVDCLDVWGQKQDFDCLRPSSPGVFPLTANQIAKIKADPAGTGFTPRKGADSWLPMPMCPRTGATTANPVWGVSIADGVQVGVGVWTVCVEDGGKFTLR